ncbi:MAG: hypothetical protein HQL19_01315 [Candidatus Omnitrophica bacterium]|nr:hypothetical protein [Candidatus Omnitrophota bacterium]
MSKIMYPVMAAVLTAAILGCSSPKAVQPSVKKAIPVAAIKPQSGDTKAFEPFYVYRDKSFRNRFTPSGYMPTGECVSLDDGWQYDVKDGKTCVRIVYDVACSKEGRKWIGIYWQNPPDNWGGKKGGYNLTGASRLVFWAKGEMGGERVEEFRVGGMGANQLYPDSDTASIGPVILSKEWKEYTIDLRGKDLSYISGGFAWVANVDGNPHHCTFYLDNIRYE